MMSNLFCQLLLVIPFTTTVATLSILPDHRLPPSNHQTLFHLSYRILEETAAGTFVANLFKDMKMHESPYRLFHLDLSTQRIPLTHFNRFHIISDFQNQSVERSSGALGQFDYTLVNLPGFSSGNSNATQFFEIRDGILQSSVNIDREFICSKGEDTCYVSFEVIAFVVQHNVFRQARIRVEIIDINDHEPIFQPDHINLKISEAAEAGTGFSLPLAVDRDSSRFSVETYLLVSEFFTPFELLVGRESGLSSHQLPYNGPPNLIKLLLREKLDREKVASYKLKVIAYDAGDEFVGIPSKTGSLNLDVQIADTNDNFPLFQTNSSQVDISEGHTLLEPIFKVKATDEDEGMNGEVHYGFSEETERKFGQLFFMNDVTGEIFLKSQLDREVLSIYQLSIVAKDMAGMSHPLSLTSTTFLTVNVLDINDNRPQIRVSSDDDLFCPGLERRLVLKPMDKIESNFLSSNELRKIKLFVHLSSLNSGNKMLPCFFKNNYGAATLIKDIPLEHNWVPLFRTTAMDADDPASGNGAVKMELIYLSGARNKNKIEGKTQESCSEEKFLLDHLTGRVYVESETLRNIAKNIAINDNSEYFEDISVDRNTSHEAEDYETLRQKRKHVCQLVIRATDQGWPSLSSEVTMLVIFGERPNHNVSRKIQNNTKSMMMIDSFTQTPFAKLKRPANGQHHAASAYDGVRTNAVIDEHLSISNHGINSDVGNLPSDDLSNQWLPTNTPEHDLGSFVRSKEEKIISEHWINTYLESRDLVLVLSAVLFVIMVAVTLAMVLVFNPKNYLIRICRSENLDKQLIV